MSRQLSLADALVDGRLGSNEKLARIDALIDWARVAPHVEALRTAETGRPAYPPLSMLKALYLQALYDLSDPGLEEALLDRLSFPASAASASTRQRPTRRRSAASG